MSSLPTGTHFRACCLCEALCGIAIDVEEGKIASIRGDREDPFSKGHLCPKAVALRDLQEDPDRLRQPVRRTRTGWEPLGWDEAIDEAARGLLRVQREHGKDALATYAGNPTVHNHGAMLFLPRLLRALRTRSRFSATSVDQLPHMLAAHLMFGHQMLVPVPDVDRTELFLILGSNPIASGGSMMTAPGIGARIEAIRRRGGRVVVVDPRRTETAARADEHLFIRPGSDAFFLLALLHEHFRQGPRLGMLAAFTDGLDAVREATVDFSPGSVSEVTGIPAETTLRISRLLLEAPAAVVHGRVGLSTQAFGGLCQWLINVLNVVTGNLDRAGGAMFTRPAFDLVGGPRALGLGPGSFGRRRTRVRGLPEFSGELPVAALAEEILHPGPGQVRGLLTFAGNPVLSTPNGRRLDEALRSLDFMVAIDPYLNETTRHAHLVLPPTTPLERGQYDIAFHALAVRNTARYAPPLLAPPAGARHDGEILLALEHRFERLRDGFRPLTELRARLLRRLGPEGIVDLALRLGPYGARFVPGRPGLTLRKLAAAPHGVDLGPLEPCLPGRLRTRSRRIDLAPRPFLDDLERLKAARGALVPSNGDLQLIGRRHVLDDNSWLHNAPILVKGRSRCVLLVHPEDAKARGLTEGDVARVTSRVGVVEVAVRLTEEILPGVVSLPHGYGHGREGVRLSVAREKPGVSVNDLTDDQEVDVLTGAAAFSGVRVRVEPVSRG